MSSASGSLPMHVFLYEWATGGGLIDETGSVPASLLREGAAMLSALAADFARLENCRISVLRDMRVLDLCLPGAEIIDLQSSASRHEHFERLAATADATVVIAPEFDRILFRTARDVSTAGGKLISPGAEFIRIAANKNRTAELLAAAGVPVPEAVVMRPEDSLPADFAYPAVLKPIDGAGSQNVQLVTDRYDKPEPYAWPRRLERYCPGLPASVAVLCGPAGCQPLLPCRQHISDDGRLAYRGGRLPLTGGLAERATALAVAAVAALPPTVGYVGVDLILGREADGSQDVVLEINPRLTTSYVGLRAAARCNLAEAMCRIALGETYELGFDERPLEFDCEGNVSYEAA